VFRSDADFWQEAADRAPDSPRAWTGLSHVRRIQGRLADADDADARALALDPTYAPARLTRAYNLLARGDLVEARAELSALDEDDHLAGLRHARECASLEPAQVPACIAR
jgi:predicted Zn-dependent protease